MYYLKIVGNTCMFQLMCEDVMFDSNVSDCKNRMIRTRKKCFEKKHSWVFM